MSIHQTFLASILESPEEDAPRLIYSDWLQDHGEPERAELIRLQIDLAKMTREDPRRKGMVARERELLDEWAWQWAEPLADHINEWVFRRGFIEKVETCLEMPANEIRELLALAVMPQSELEFGLL